MDKCKGNMQEPEFLVLGDSKTDSINTLVNISDVVYRS